MTYIRFIKTGKYPRKERYQMIGLGFVGLAEDLILILTLGYVVPSFRAWYLFDFIED